MNKESLLKAREIIIDIINNENKIIPIDKIELIINLNELLNPNNYDEDIELLKKQNIKRKWKNER